MPGQGLLQLRQQTGDTVGHGDDVGAGLALDGEDDGRAEALFPVGHIGGQTGVLRALLHGGHIFQTQGRAVAVADDGPRVFLGRGQLVVGIDGTGALGPVKAALGVVDVGRSDGRAHVGHGQPGRGQGRGIDLHPHRGPLPARQGHQAHAGDLRNLLRQPGVHQVFQPGQRHGVTVDRQRHDGRVRRVDLVVDRRVGQVGWQQVVRRVDGGLHLLLGHVQRHGKVELQGDDRSPGRRQGGHLHKARHGAQLPFQRRGDHRGHDLGGRAGVQGLHLDGGVVDLRQGRHGQIMIGQQPGKEQGHHQQRGGDGPEDEDAGNVHGAARLSSGNGGGTASGKRRSPALRKDGRPGKEGGKGLPLPQRAGARRRQHRPPAGALQGKGCPAAPAPRFHHMTFLPRGGRPEKGSNRREGTMPHARITG